MPPTRGELISSMLRCTLLWPIVTLFVIFNVFLTFLCIISMQVARFTVLLAFERGLTTTEPPDFTNEMDEGEAGYYCARFLFRPFCVLSRNICSCPRQASEKYVSCAAEDDSIEHGAGDLREGQSQQRRRRRKGKNRLNESNRQNNTVSVPGKAA